MKTSNMLLVGVAMLSTPTHAASGATCTVQSIDGSAAEVWRNGTILTLRDAMPLMSNDRIETGAGTRLTVLCSEGTRITIGPETSIDLGDFTSGGSNWSSFLMEGVSWFARPFFRDDRFEVRTPSAVASVRSTEWFVDVKEGATAVFVDEGGVLVSASDSGTLLEADLGIDVSASGVAGPAKRWGKKRIDALRQRLGFTPE